MASAMIGILSITDLGPWAVPVWSWSQPPLFHPKAGSVPPTSGIYLGDYVEAFTRIS